MAHFAQSRLLGILEDPYTPLSQLYDKVLAILEKQPGPDLACENQNGYFPLLIATARGDPSVVRLLLDSGADVQQCMSEPWFSEYHAPTALHQACVDGEHDLVELLFLRDESGTMCKLKNFQGLTPLLLAVQSGCIEVVKLLLQLGCCVQDCDDDGNGALHITLMTFPGSKDDMLQCLFEAGVDCLCRNSTGLSPVRLAALTGDRRAVWLLLEQTRKIYTQSESTKICETLDLSELELAVIDQDCDKIVQCLSQSDICQTHFGDSLYLAVEYGDRKILSLLLESKPDIVGVSVNKHSGVGVSPLSLACQYMDFTMAKLLLDHGADPNLLSQGVRPLKTAVILGQKDLVLTLLQSGADCWLVPGDGLRIQNHSLVSPTLFLERWDILRLLVVAGVSVCSIPWQSHDLQALETEFLLCCYKAGYRALLQEFVTAVGQSTTETAHVQNMLQEIQVLVRDPYTLQDLCTQRIRGCLQGRVWYLVPRLKIPALLQSCLLLGQCPSEVTEYDKDQLGDCHRRYSMASSVAAVQEEVSIEDILLELPDFSTLANHHDEL